MRSPHLVLMFLVPALLAPVVPVSAESSPGIPLVDPDVSASTEPVAVVPVLDREYWSFTAGFRGRNITVPDVEWNRVVLVFNQTPRGDPWDRLFAASIHGVEVLRGTTPRANMTVEKDVTRYASLLPPKGDVRVEAYTDTWVGGTGMEITLHLDFYNDTSVDYVEPPAAAVHKVSRFAGLCTGGSTTSLVDFGEGAPDSATVEVFASGHGSEEFWFLSPNPPRTLRVLVDGEEVGRAHLMPYTYAFLGFAGSNGAQNPTTLLVHEVMWWTVQKHADRAGVHHGTGEVAPYRITLDEEARALLTGEREVTVAVDSRGTGSESCVWVTSVNVVVDA